MGFAQLLSPNIAQTLSVRGKYVKIISQPIKKRKDIAVRKASIASVNVFKGLFAHCLCNPPVS
jgi:hypothetical protein